MGKQTAECPNCGGEGEAESVVGDGGQQMSVGDADFVQYKCSDCNEFFMKSA